MAFNPGNLLEFARICRRFALGGRCLTLGRQDVHMNLDATAALLVRTGHFKATQNGIEVPIPLAVMMQSGAHLSNKPMLQKLNCISDKALFAALGFASMQSVDVSAYEDADFIYDMNLPGMGEQIGTTYQVVLDPGTTEHVFDFATALENVHDVLAIGGVLVQGVALSNRIDHGFYQVSPDLLLDYYEANAYEVLATEVVRVHLDQASLMSPALAYVRGALGDRVDGGMDAGSYKAAVVARKTERATKGRFPTPSSLAWAEKPGCFPASALRWLGAARQRLGIGGHCLTLGANPCFAEARVLREVAPSVAGDGTLSDRQALGALGFERVTVLDCAPGPGVDRTAVLDRDDAAAAIGGPYDFVLDWGASSRVFRLAAWFRSLFAAVRIGGAVWHIVPTQNLIGRGHYMICPTLLHDFYTINRWEILAFEIVHVRSWYDDAWFAAPYDAGTADFMSFGKAPPGAFLTAALVRRTADSTGDRIPQQSWFGRYTDFTERLSPAPDA